MRDGGGAPKTKPYILAEYVIGENKDKQEKVTYP